MISAILLVWLAGSVAAVQLPILRWLLLIVGGVTVGLVIGWSMCPIRPLGQVAAVFGYVVLLGVAATAPLLGRNAGLLFVVPFVTLASVLPYFSEKWLRVFTAAAFATAIEVATCAVLISPARSLPFSARLVIWGGPAAAVLVFVPLLMRQYLARLNIAAAFTDRTVRQAWFLADVIPQLVFVTDPHWKIEYANARWYEYTGISSIEGLHAAEASTHPEDRAAVLESWREAGPREGEPVETEFRIRRADGSYRWFLCRAQPVRDPSGTVVRWFATLTDVDDRKRAAETLRFVADATESLGASLDLPRTLDALAELAVPRLADVCIVHLIDEWTGEGRPVSVADVVPARSDQLRRALGRFPLESVEEKPIFRHMRQGDALRYEWVSDEVLGQLAQSPEQLGILKAVGLRSAMFLPLSHAGRFLGILSLFSTSPGRRFGEEDLSVARELAHRTAQAVEKARLYQELQEAVRIREDLVSVAGHELKTPLTTLHLQLQLLQQLAQASSRAVPTDRVKAKTDALLRQLQRLEQLVNDLLDVSRISGRATTLEPERVELGALVKEVVARLRPDLERAGCRVRLHIVQPVVGWWDRLKLERIVTNLVSNAAKFGAGRPVEISAWGDGDRAHLQVRDHGIGIAPQDQARIFQRFERGVSQRRYGGLGLGLWIVRQLAEAMGGSVRVQSALGQGATFTVEVLRAPPPAEAERPTLH